MPQYTDNTGTLRKYARPCGMLVEDWLNLAYCAELRAVDGVLVDGSPYNPRHETTTRNAMIRLCVGRLDEMQGPNA